MIKKSVNPLTFEWSNNLYFAALRPKDVTDSQITNIGSLVTKLKMNLKEYVDTNRIQIIHTSKDTSNVLYIRYIMLDNETRSFPIVKVITEENYDIRHRKYDDVFQVIFQIKYHHISILNAATNDPSLFQEIPDEDADIISKIVFIVNHTIGAVPAIDGDGPSWLEHDKTIFTLGQMIKKHRDAGFEFLELHPDYIPKEYINEAYYAWKTNQLNRALLKEYDTFDNVTPEKYYKDISSGIIHV